MRLLLDTHSLLWWVESAPQLSSNAEGIIASAEAVCYVSTASAWEMAIKASQGKLRLSLNVHQYFRDHLPANDFQQLDMTLAHVTAVETLPFHHRDRVGNGHMTRKHPVTNSEKCRGALRSLLSASTTADWCRYPGASIGLVAG